MHDYLGVVTAAQEEERKRLARELHDEAIQDLIALKQRVQMARRGLAREPGALEGQLAELQAMLETAIQDVRRFSRALRPIYLEEAGLVAALEGVARDAGQRQMQVTFDVDGEPRRLPPEAELALYRIVQEALSNVARHAHASKVQVRIAYDHDVVVRVQDDGLGFTAPERVSDLATAGHYGLMGMQERAQLVGAHLTVASAPGAGTTVEICYPGREVEL
jgi:signal transduction histidine kinase